MLVPRPRFRFGRTLWPWLAALAVLAAGFALARSRASAESDPHAHHHHGMQMSDAEMREHVDAWFARHPRTGGPSRAAANATVQVRNFRFEADGNSGTQVDTVKIVVGQSVTWQWIEGIHSITSGTGSGDPNAGMLFNQPSDNLNTTFTFTFTTVGTVPYFCGPHELSNMRGVVVVRPADATVQVVSFRFEADGNSGTQVDTVKIDVGESVLWQWGDGIHTITSGTGSGDPQAGALFNEPSDSNNPMFTHTFTSVGTVPYFCIPHEGLANMRGVVVVSQTTGVQPLPGAATAAGFISAPGPNPTRGAVSFRFAMLRPGRARAEVFDARGRRVAVLADRELSSGVFAAGWDGRTLSGAPASAGIYWIRLRLPDWTGSRRITLAH